MATVVDSIKLEEKKEVKNSPEEHAGLISRLFFFWAGGLFARASLKHKEGKALEAEDLFDLPERDETNHLHDLFEKGWNGAKADATSKEKLLSAIKGVAGPRFFYLAALVKVFNSLAQFTFPILLSGCLQVIAGEKPWGIEQLEVSSNLGFAIAGLIGLFMSSKALLENQYFHIVIRTGYQVRSAVTTAVYRKSLKLSAASRQTQTLGQMVNYMQLDASKFEMFAPQFHVLWDGFFQICGYMVILYNYIGPSCFVGLLFMMFSMPLQLFIMKKLMGYSRIMVKHTDARVKVVNEAMQGMQCVKMYSWENNFVKLMQEHRDLELGLLKSTAYLRAFSRAYMGAVPVLTSVVSFLVYAALGGEIRANVLFAAIAAFGQLRFPLLFYPMSLAQLAQAKVSLRRVSDFLDMGEVVAISSPSEKELPNGTVEAKNATYAWIEEKSVQVDSKDKEEKKTKKGKGKGKGKKEDKEKKKETKAGPVLEDISISVKPGSLTAVVGPVGVGKSSLCSGLLGEMVTLNGTFSVSGSVAYAAQTPWILNDTIRNNIIFGKPFDKERYWKIVRASQLSHDLEILENGDKTMVGEKGINLSGGQKQRISVCRAAYAEADVTVLDDPLSALDPEVGNAVFDECIKGVLSGTTRILVTNQLHVLKECDHIIVLSNKDGVGRITEQGRYDELVSAKREFAALIKTFVGKEEKAEKEKDGEKSEKSGEKKRGERANSETYKKMTKNMTQSEKGKLMQAEERNVGAVKLTNYKRYLKAGGGLGMFALTYSFFVFTMLLQLLVRGWISLWTADATPREEGGPTYQNFSYTFYMAGYAIVAVLVAVVTYGRSALLAVMGVRASRNLHTELVQCVMRAPTSFFDTTPVGRIVSRFAKDLNTIDGELPNFFDFFLFCTLFVCFTMITIISVTPLFALVAVPAMTLYILTLNYFRRVSREAKRLESIARSPVYSHYSETLGGINTIRAYRASPRFLKENAAKVDNSIRGFYVNKVADRWLSVRLELLGSFIGFGSAMMAVATAVIDHGEEPSDPTYVGLAGLALSFAIQVTGLLNWTVRSFANVESGMNATERVLHYIDEIPQEAAHVSENPPDASWPQAGKITLVDVQMRYRNDTPLVLKGLNLTINAGEKVGVVGRTGSGKSSLLLTLLRLVEPTDTSKILIDGVDITKIGISELRRKLGIIPQNPTLFSGTIRGNLDPFNEHSDAEINEALSKCEMLEAVNAMDGGLDAAVAEYGENLSQGQRQLLCLGRALLSHTKILLLDEATSSVDVETDAAVQKTLRSAFKDCTLLTIAHRVNTIIDSDRIIVLKDGLVAENDSPKKLLVDLRGVSMFSEMVQELGDRAYESLTQRL